MQAAGCSREDFFLQKLEEIDDLIVYGAVKNARLGFKKKKTRLMQSGLSHLPSSILHPKMLKCRLQWRKRNWKRWDQEKYLVRGKYLVLKYLVREKY